MNYVTIFLYEISIICENKLLKKNKKGSLLSNDPAFLVGDGGFEPPKSKTTDLQSAPFGRSGNLPKLDGAGGRT